MRKYVLTCVPEVVGNLGRSLETPRRLEEAKSIKKEIKQLEARLGVRLLARTTRQVTPTVDGAAYYERCIAILADVEEAETQFTLATRAPEGRVRIDLSAGMCRNVLLPALPDFTARYPQIRLEISVSDRPIDLLREKLILLPLCASLLVHLSTISLMLTMPFRLQHAYGYSPVEAGLAIAPWSIVMMVVAPAAGAMSDRFKPGQLSSLGMLLALAGTLTLVFLPEHPDHFDIGWRFVLTGTGYGLFFSPNSRQIIAGAPARRAAAAGAIMQTFRLSGQLLGSTVAALWLALGLGDGMAPPLAAAVLTIPTGILCLLVLGAASRDAPLRQV